MTDLTLKFAKQFGLGDWLARSWANLTEGYAKYRQYRQSIDEVSRLSDRELADIGISRSALRASIHEAVYKS